MIRRLHSEDHEICMNFLKKEPAKNLFIIGDIEIYGYDKEFQKLWGEFSKSGDLVAILLKYEENYIPYAEGDFNALGFAQIILADPDFTILSGLSNITEKIVPYLNRDLKENKQLYYTKCTSVNSQASLIDTSNVKKAIPSDVPRIVETLNSIPEFSHTTFTVERKLRELEDGVSRTFFIEQDSKIISIASTAAENSMSAMVVGVATLEDHKKKGYATHCMVKLCTELLQEGKELCLFYENPLAGVIYKRIGFEDIDRWSMYLYKKAK